MTKATTIRINLPRLYAAQHAAVFDPARIACIEASTKAGKTVGCLIWQGSRVLQDQNEMAHWWIAPFTTVADIAFNRARKMFPSREFRVNETDRMLTFRNGATWRFRSGEKPDSLYGEDVADAVIDEASRVRVEAWHAIRSTLTATRGPVRMIGNVKGRKNWFYQLARRAQSGEHGMAYHRLTGWYAVVGGVLEAQEIHDAERQLPPAVFRELYMAEPADDGGNPFGIAAIQACKLEARSLQPTAFFGIDLAKSVDWTWIIGLDAEGRQTVSERFQADWRTTKSRILHTIGFVPAYIDSSGVGDPVVEELQRERSNVVGYKFTGPSKQQLMEGLQTAIHQGQIRFFDEALIMELEQFEYEFTRTGVRYSAPAGLHDDGVMGLALANRARTEMVLPSFVIA